MTGWVILVDKGGDLPNAETPHKVISTGEYLARPRLFDMGRPKIVNLARSYAYQSKGYYASLLAEARGHRVAPAAQNSSPKASPSSWSASASPATRALSRSAACCSTGSAARRWK